MHLSLSYLQVFDTVAQHGNITRAAETLSVSQPAISKQIRLLERQVGVLLLERIGKGVRLTSAGESLFGYTRRIFSLVDEARTSLDSLQGLHGGKLAIGAGTTVGVYLLPDVLVKFRRQFGGISLKLNVGASELLKERLRDGLIEFAVMEKSLPSPEFDSTLLMSDELVGIVRPGHHASKFKSISAALFAKEPLVVREGEPGARSLAERVLAERRITVKPVISLSSTEAVKRAVAAGLGVSIVSKMSLGAEVEAGKLIVVKLRDVSLRRPIYIVRLRTRSQSKAAKAFVEMLKDNVRARWNGLTHYAKHEAYSKLTCMIQLTPGEARVLGVLIEKGFTTPNQYPLSINAVSNGANQLSNRDPVMQMSEDQAFDSAESLRGKQLVIRVDQVGSRVHKYKHIAVETLHCRQAEIAVLAELLLRGPQTLGELRSRASRMQPFDSLERVTEMLRALMERSDPLVKELPPSPGSRAERYAQLLCPDAHPLEAASPVEVSALAPAKSESPGLESRVLNLESEVKTLKDAIRSISEGLGIPDPTDTAHPTADLS